VSFSEMGPSTWMQPADFSTQRVTVILYQPWSEDRIKALRANDLVFYADLNDNRRSRGGYVRDCCPVGTGLEAASVGVALQVRQCGRKAYRYGPSVWEIISERGLSCFSASSKHVLISSRRDSRSVQA
jgi:hypothetical protein